MPDEIRPVTPDAARARLIAEVQSDTSPYLRISESAAAMIISLCWPHGYELDVETRQALEGVIRLVCASVEESTRVALGHSPKCALPSPPGGGR